MQEAMTRDNSSKANKPAMPRKDARPFTPLTSQSHYQDAQ